MMWPRVSELHMALWLLLSPFIFSYGDSLSLWVVSYTSAVAAAFVALWSFRGDSTTAHFWNCAIGVALVIYVLVVPVSPPPPAYQNLAVIGLILLMLGVLPNRCDVPPKEWQQYLAQKRTD